MFSFVGVVLRYCLGFKIFFCFFLPLFLSIMISSSVSAAELYTDEVIVTATAAPINVTDAGTSVTIITADDIKAKNPNLVQDILQSIPEISISSSGVNVTSVGIRGGAADSVMILVDGIPFLDPSGLNGYGNINSISPSDIERVEIVSGPASSVYGNGAMGGVINIITKKSGNRSIFTGGGSYGAYYYGGSFGIEIDQNNSLYVGGRYYKEDGLSLADKRFGNDEKDGYDIKSIMLKYVFDNGTVNNTAAFTHNSNFVNTDNVLVDDSSHSDETTSMFYDKFALNFSDYLNPSFEIGAIDTQRDYYSSNFFGPGYFESDFSSSVWYYGLSNRMNLSDIAVINAGVKKTMESADNSYSPGKYNTADTKEGFLNSIVRPSKNWNILLGARYADIDGFSSALTYSASTSFHIESAGLTLKATSGSGYKAPSLDKINNPKWGNKDLKPQKSSSWEVGFIHTMFNNNLIWGVTYFNTFYDDKISGYEDWSTQTMKFTNTDLKSNGVDVHAAVYVYDLATINLAYNYNETKERKNDIETIVYKRPKHKASGSISFFPIRGVTTILEAVYTDKVTDIFYGTVTSNKVLPSYTLYNFYFMYDLDDFNLNVKVMNIGNKKYETSYGYSTKRLDLQAGISYNF